MYALSKRRALNTGLDNGFFENALVWNVKSKAFECDDVTYHSISR